MEKIGRSKESIAFSTENHLSLDKLGVKGGDGGRGQWSGEREKVHSAARDNECFVRKNPSMVTRGSETSGKVMVCWFFNSRGLL